MLDSLLEASVRPYLAALLVAAGAGAVVAGLRHFRSARALVDPHRALGVARGIRLGIFGLCAIALAYGWLFEVDWVVLLALIILGEEMLEATVVIAALRDGVRMRDRETPAGFGAPRSVALAGVRARGTDPGARVVSGATLLSAARARRSSESAGAASLRGAPRGRLEPRPFVSTYGYRGAFTARPVLRPFY